MLPPSRSFKQQWGSNLPLYAADVVHAATALLEAPSLVRTGEAAGPRDDKSDQFWCARTTLNPLLSGVAPHVPAMWKEPQRKAQPALAGQPGSTALIAARDIWEKRMGARMLPKKAWRLPGGGHNHESRSQQWHACPSWRRKAWNCLAVRDSGELQQGIELSKRLQRAILRYAASYKTNGAMACPGAQHVTVCASCLDRMNVKPLAPLVRAYLHMN